MRAVQQFTYPTFMGICGILAAFADILQNRNIFSGVLVTLLVLGGLAAVFCIPFVARKVPERWVSEDLLKKFGIDPSIKEALVPFSLSCFILAAGIYVFSAMSAQASEKGGALVSTFPDLKPVQLALGRVEQDVNELKQQTTSIKQDTERLLETAVSWISLEAEPSHYMLTTTSGEMHYFAKGFYVTLTNETGQAFEDISLKVSDGSELLLVETLQMLPQNGYKHYLHDGSEALPSITVCVSGKRRGSNDWVTETRTYQAAQKRLTDIPSYDVIDVTDRVLSADKPECLPSST